MYGILFRVEAKPEKFQELVDLLTWDAKICRDQEPGTLRFEFYQDPENENALYGYEAYRDLEALEVHKQNEAFKRFFYGGLKEELTTDFSVVFRGNALFSPTD